jgi:hypothetical protein
MSGYFYFMTRIAPTQLSKSFLVTIEEHISPEDLHKSIFLFMSDKKPSSKWPLAAFIDTVLATCNITAHRFHQFHKIKLDNPKDADSDIWEMIKSGTEVCNRSKQKLNRFSKKNQVTWPGVWSQIAPLSNLFTCKCQFTNFQV